MKRNFSDELPIETQEKTRKNLVWTLILSIRMMIKIIFVFGLLPAFSDFRAKWKIKLLTIIIALLTKKAVGSLILTQKLFPIETM